MAQHPIDAAPQHRSEFDGPPIFPQDFQNGKSVYTEPVPEFYESVLQEADRITSNQRREKYGPPAEDFAKVTGMAMALWGRGPESPAEHSLYMILVKLAREVHAHQRDNLVDIAGYIKTYEEIVYGEEDGSGQ